MNEMADRSRDWLAQAEQDLEAAASLAQAGHHEWACFVCQQAAEIIASFPGVQSMVAASTTMPVDDSDRLMRYQTALEKQLSRYIGEFLALQKLAPVLS